MDTGAGARVHGWVRGQAGGYAVSWVRCSARARELSKIVRVRAGMVCERGERDRVRMGHARYR